MRRKYEKEYEIVSIDRGRKNYRYRGEWFHIDMNASAYRRFWVIQLLLALLSLAVWVGASFCPSRSLYYFYAFLPYLITLIPILNLIILAAFCPFHPAPMEHRMYDGQFGRQKWLVRIATATDGLALLTALAALIQDAQSPDRASLLHLALLAALLLPLLLLHSQLSRLKIVRSQTKEPPAHN